MWRRFLKDWRVPAATLFSAVLIGGSYLLAQGAAGPNVAEASTETALLQSIASKDSNGDGLPDWEKALYGIPADATTTDYFNLGMTDGEAVAKGLIVPKAIAYVPAPPSPASSSGFDYAADGLTPPTQGTLTDAFSQQFFTLYLAAKQGNGGADLSEDQTNSIMTQALGSLASSVTTAPDFSSPSSIAVSGSGASALAAFAASAEAVLEKNVSSATTSELVYLQYAATDNDPAALAQIVSIAQTYRDSAIGLAALPAPQELASADRALINALMRMSEIISDFARVNTDSLATMLALQQYLPAAQVLGAAFDAVDSVYATEGVALPSGTPGASFAHFDNP